MKTTTQTLIPSVNFHLWEPCNFRCKFCFATFQDVRKTVLPKGHLPKAEALRLIESLALAGFSKITFAGGEPTLCPWLGDLIVKAKVLGLTTMVVTNGSGITNDFLNDVNGFLDWVVLSIDSLDPRTNLSTGRSQGFHKPIDETYYRDKISLVRSYKIKLKINTVVNRKNYKEIELGNFIREIMPDRWKIFKALRVEGQNDLHFNEVDINLKQLDTFLFYNCAKGLKAIVEDNEEMTGTYIMIDPAGRFFDNTQGKHNYSRSILEVGVQKALEEITYDFERFVERGGLYAW